MKLSALVADLPEAEVRGDVSVDVTQVTDDSRNVAPGDVFVAVRGLRSDGHAFAASAAARGAAALVVDHPVDLASDHAVDLASPAGPDSIARIPAQIIVPDTARALGVLVARLAGRPGDRLTLVGITGTNGKTTTTFLVESILGAAGARPGVIGTVSYRYGGLVKPAPYTTPTPAVLHGAFAEMVASGCSHAVLEVSSAALAMNRLAGVDFQVAAFTNFTQDHLDIHHDMASYRAAKALLFSQHMAGDGIAVINLDDSEAGFMTAAAGQHRVLGVSARPDVDAGADADADASELAAGTSVGTLRRFAPLAVLPERPGGRIAVIAAESTIAGIEATIATPRGALRVASPLLLGAYNVANLAMAVAISEALGIDHEAIARGIATMPGVPGRVERVANDRGLDILVDYAHTPDALRNVLSALGPLTERRLICVFGCGGDRDPSKRPRMGAAVAELADVVVVTSDNPRTEEPQAILDMILPAVPDPFFVDLDRRVAIQAAVAEATPGDIVLIAGKGHEDYQILGTEKVHFDDREEAARAAALRWDFPLAEVLAACDGKLVKQPESAAGTAASTAADAAASTAADAAADAAPRFARVHFDGRMAAPGDLYVAIRGETLDGHDFCAQAVAAGATGVLVEPGRADAVAACGDAHVIEARDGRQALGAIARWHRRRWAENQAPDTEPRRRVLVGLTGSTGKTTTKELARAALGSRVHATRGSLNNETGVPLSLLGLRHHHDVAIIEMGMRRIGDIAYLCDMAGPTIGVVINAGVAHVGVVGSVEDIARGKSEIFARLPPDGAAIFPAGDARLAEHARNARAPRCITFGSEPGADVRLLAYRPAGQVPGLDSADYFVGAEVRYRVGDRELAVRLPLPGEHNAIDGACALAIALACGVDVEQAARGLERARPAAMRSEIIGVAGRHILFDCYNANPASTAAALRTVAELRGAGRAVAVLGDMLELGDTARDAHRSMGELAARLHIEVIAIGEHRGDVLAGARDRSSAASDPAHAAHQALDRTRPGDWILVKGSRGMRLERVVEAMRSLSQAAGTTREAAER